MVSQNSVPQASFFNKVTGQRSETLKETLAHILSPVFCEFFKKPSFLEHVHKANILFNNESLVKVSLQAGVNKKIETCKYFKAKFL